LLAESRVERGKRSAPLDPDTKVDSAQNRDIIA